ncbi:hypothetical protein [Alkalihalobacterium elongatum]|uniref:hypothetical protein n=1 Tax=Alkalihalobacterium elongatum TaxID=2675466 RepID=UPI001C1FE036|nr:hypothetical protein [Alkalihalobacterium elongatum]
MKLTILSYILAITLIISGCSLGNQSKVAKSISSPPYFENQHLSVAYTGHSTSIVNDENAFYLSFEIEQIGPYPIDEKHFSFSLQRVIEDDLGNEYASVKTEVIRTTDDGEALPENKVYFRQYFQPELNSNSAELAVLFYAKPMYYRQSVLFENLKHDVENKVENDLNIARIQTDRNRLMLYIEDVHNVQGIETTILYSGEEIYPVSTSTELGKFNYSVIANYEFAIDIPNPLTLKIKRHRLQDQLWDFPLTITLK